MFWFIDVIVILIIALSAWIGLKKGFFATGYVLVGRVLVVMVASFLASAVVLTFSYFNLDVHLSKWIVSVIAKTSGEEVSVSLNATKVVVKIILSAVAFFLCYLAVALMNKKLVSCLAQLRRFSVFKIFDGAIGLAVNLCFSLAIVFGVFSVLFALSEMGLTVIKGALLECPISSLVFTYNPLNEIVSESQIVKAVSTFLS